MASSIPDAIKSQNFYRIVSLLVDTGTVVLRRLTEKHVLAVSRSLDQHLSDCKQKLSNLQNKHILNQSQMDLLFPICGSADVEIFDITLLSCLLTNVCGKLPPQEKQEIEKLRELRNKVFSHIPKAKIEETDFKSQWGEICQVMKNLAKHCPDPAISQQVQTDINELWNNPKLQPSSYNTDQLKKWREQDNNADKERLRSSLLSIYKRNYSSMSVDPLYEEENVPLDSLFTDLVIVEEAKDGSGTTDCPVTSYEDIFLYKENENRGLDAEKVKSVVMLGEAGSGKTVYSQQIVNKWVKCQMKLESEQVNLEDKDEQMMAHFDFLFYVPLRYIKKSENLDEAIYQSVGDDALNQATTQQVFRDCPDKILVICDGLDEINWYPSRHNFHMFTIVTTTRPWKYDQIKGRSPRKDRILKLRGLGKDGDKELASRLRKTCYPNQPESSVENFFQEVREKLCLKVNLNENPLILVYLLHVWFLQNELSKSLALILLDVISCILERGENKLASSGDNLIQHNFSRSQEKLKGLPLDSDRHDCCYKYGEVLMTAARIAFKGLTNAQKENTLIFSDRNLSAFISNESGIKPEYLDACQKLGLISKSERTHILHKEHRFSFPHKLLQEVFTSLDIVNTNSALTEFCNYCQSLDKVLEMSEVFIFTMALCTKTALQLSSHVVEICDKDKTVSNFRSDIFAERKELIEDLTKMYVRCMEEHLALKPGENCDLYMSDMFVDNFKEETNWQVLTILLQTNVRRLRSCYLRSDDTDKVNRILEKLTEVTSLNRLHLICSEPKNLQTGHINKILLNNSQLRVLHIEGGYGDLPAGLELPQLPRLQHLYINQVTTSRVFLQGLMKQKELKTLQLLDVDIHDIALDMSLLTKLHHLHLDMVKMPWDFWWRMLESINHLPALKKLGIDMIPSDETVDTPDIRPKFVSTLHKLELTCLLPSPVFQHILQSDVGHGSQMKILIIHGPATSATTLLSIIQQLHHLEELQLHTIDTDNQHLKIINTSLKVLKLWSVNMPIQAWSQLFVSITSLHQLTKLDINMEGINMEESICQPDPDSWSKLFDSIQFLHHLTELTLDFVHIPPEVAKIPSDFYIHRRYPDKDDRIK